MSTPNHRRHFGALGATASGIKVSSGGRELLVLDGAPNHRCRDLAILRSRANKKARAVMVAIKWTVPSGYTQRLVRYEVLRSARHRVLDLQDRVIDSPRAQIANSRKRRSALRDFSYASEFSDCRCGSNTRYNRAN
jgi:hypothetical protein